MSLSGWAWDNNWQGRGSLVDYVLKGPVLPSNVRLIGTPAVSGNLTSGLLKGLATGANVNILEAAYGSKAKANKKTSSRRVRRSSPHGTGKAWVRKTVKRKAVKRKTVNRKAVKRKAYKA